MSDPGGVTLVSGLGQAGYSGHAADVCGAQPVRGDTGLFYLTPLCVSVCGAVSWKRLPE